MPRPVYLSIQKHIENPLRLLRESWYNCTRCDLSEIRRRVVHVRGKLPCQVLFVGEAPGESENIIGYPFVGDSGHLLNELIDESVNRLDHIYTYAVTNIVGCYPGKDEAGNFITPHKTAVSKCEPHLRRLIEIAAPRLIATLGVFAAKKLPVDIKASYHYVELAHPSSLLRLQSRGRFSPQANPAEYALRYNRFILTLCEAIRKHVMP